MHGAVGIHMVTQ